MTDYRRHAKIRYKERFGRRKQIQIKEMSDQMYDEIVALYNRGFYTYRRPSKRKGYKAVIDYEGILMWGIFSSKNKILKTVYPLKTNEKKRYNMLVEASKKKSFKINNAIFRFNEYKVIPKPKQTFIKRLFK